MKTIILFVTMLLLLGCSIMKPPQPQVIEVVKIEYKERLKDTTIYVQVPKEVLIKETMDTTSFLQTSVAKSSVVVSQGKMTHTLENKDSLRTKIVYKDILVTRDSIVVRKEPYPVEKKLTWWQDTRMRFGGWAMLICLGFVGFFVVRKLI